MVVKTTAVLDAKLVNADISRDVLVKKFQAWKSGDEYGTYIFGKDSDFITPHVNHSPYLLRHVHLVPVSDKSALVKWEQLWNKRTRKTSDRFLVYVKDNQDNYLLITILSEPGSHKITEMKTQNDRDLMGRLAIIAEAFINDGDVIA